jgi:TRAP-type mannitol/chloroaromatic compound transport system substrate-binding protein
MLSRYDAVNAPALKRLISAGAVVRPFPQPVLEVCHRATQEHFGEIAAKDAKFKKGFDSVTAFLRDRVQWLQLSDLAYDAFQIAINSRA